MVDGFIGVLQCRTNQMDRQPRIMRITHAVSDGVATRIEEAGEDYRQWLEEKNGLRDYKQGYTIAAIGFGCIGDGETVNNRFFIAYDKQVLASSKKNLCFPMNRMEFGYFYLDKGTYDRQLHSLFADITDKAKQAIESVNDRSQGHVNVTFGQDTEEFLQLMTLPNLPELRENLGKCFMYRYHPRANRFTGEQLNDAMRKFKRDIIYCDMQLPDTDEIPIVEERLTLPEDMFDGVIARVKREGWLQIESVVKNGEVYGYDKENPEIVAAFGDKPVPSEIRYNDQSWESGSKVYIAGIHELRVVTNFNTAYYLDSFEHAYANLPLADQVTKNVVWSWNSEIHMPVKAGERDAYGRIRLQVYDYLLLDNTRYVCEDAPVERTYTLEETEALYQLFAVYYPEAKPFSEADEGEREILADCIRVFLPDGCETDALLDKLRYRDRIEQVLGISAQTGFVQDTKRVWCSQVEEYYRNSFTARVGGRTVPMSNDLLNIGISFAQSFITVISGKPGSAKGALVDAIGMQMGLNGLFTEAGEDVSRYQELTVSKTWTGKKVFMDSIFRADSPYREAFELLDYEAQNRAISIELPYIFALKNADAAEIDTYFEDFITISKNWYRKEHQQIGTSGFSLSKNMRVMMTVSSEQGMLSDEFAATTNVVYVEDSERLIQEIEKVNPSVFRSYFDTWNVKTFLPDITPDERWEDENAWTKSCRTICERLMELLSSNMEYAQKPVVFEKNRILHAISRYWIVAKDYMTGEPDKSMEEILHTLLPEGVAIDEASVEPRTKQVVPEIVALDYAAAQRILPCVTKRTGEVELRNASELIAFLLQHRLYRCAAELKHAIETGRVKLSTAFSEEENQQFIIRKCETIYKKNFELAGKTDRDPQELLGSFRMLINRFRDKEAYTQNVVANMLICLVQGFLTVFSGKPGCGKTSICKLIGECLGLTDYNHGSSSVTSAIRYPEFRDARNETVNPSRFLEVSTERGWTSKRDFIGYYNPLTEQFDKTNADLYNAFLVMDKEGEKPDTAWPLCLILLDEANLSPMEYYWADFMNLCEAWQPGHSIDLGGGRVFHIPESLHFMATINNDHTTELLSPRLIDRANVIDLPDASYRAIEELAQQIAIRPVTWENLKRAFGCAEQDAVLFNRQDMAEETLRMAAVYKHVKSFVEGRFKVSISPRTDIAVSRYWTIAAQFFTEETYVIKENLLQQLKQNHDMELSESEQLAYIHACVCQWGELEKKLAVTEVPQGYTTCTVLAAVQAMDYAVAQRVLPKLTDISGETAFDSLIALLGICVEYGLYKSAGIVTDMIERGYDTGFYNYFR